MKTFSISASKLKTYMECPAQYYWRYVARKPETTKSASIKLTPAGAVKNVPDENPDIRLDQEPSAVFDSGKLVHRVLELAAKKRTSNATCSKKVTKKELLGLLEVAVTEPPTEEWQRPLIISPETIESASKVLALCWKKISFPFTISAEKKFRVSIGAIEDDKGNVVIEEAFLTGVIDRIDKLPVGRRIKIVDYKSGWSVMSIADAEQDPQINFYLAVAKLMFPDDDVSMELWYLNRGQRLGPIHYTEARKDWLLGSYVRPILSKLATWGKYPETPGSPQCYSCPRKSECVSFASMVKGSLAPVTADMGQNLALWERLGEIEGNIERLKGQIKPFINSAVEKADDGEIFAGSHRARVIFRGLTAYHSTRDTAMAAAKAILEAKKPPATAVQLPADPEPQKQDAEVVIPVDPEAAKALLVKMIEENAKLRQAWRESTAASRTLLEQLVAQNAKLRQTSLESATAFEVACKIAKTQSGLVNEFVDGLPEDVTLQVAQAVEQTASNAGHYMLEVERIQLPFQDMTPSVEEASEAERQIEQRKTLALPAGSKPILDDSHQPRTPIDVEIIETPTPAAPPAETPALAAPAEETPAAVTKKQPEAATAVAKPPAEPVSAVPIAGESLDLFPAEPAKAAPGASDERDDEEAGDESKKAAWAQADCVACGGTGISSSGRPCMPCVSNSSKTKIGAAS